MTGGGAWTAPGKTPAKDRKKKGSAVGTGGGASPQPGTPSPPLLLCDHARWVDVWRLGEGLGGAGGHGGSSTHGADKDGGGMMKLAAAPLHVLRAKLGGNRRTLCSAISPDGVDPERAPSLKFLFSRCPFFSYLLPSSSGVDVLSREY
jgi:U3 small nucleolar RNA-associated protein 4